MIKIPKETLEYVNREAAKRLRNDFRLRVEPMFLQIKERMIQEFLNHNVTKEINLGPNAENISGTLSGYGNLFSFIGFEKGDDPIKPILDILESTILINSGISRDGTMRYRVIIPTAQDIFDVTDMPWAAGRSWAKGIESGISGLGYYLNTEGGRSGQGVQSKKKIVKRKTKVPSQFKKTPYISALINKYAILFQKL